MRVVLFIILAYFMGSIPSGVWIGRYFKDIDIREHGSKNPGTTNAYRVLGPKYGIMVLAADVLKGFLPVAIASISGVYGLPLIIVGITAIIGHTLSCFLDFKGGKGVATSLGVFLYLIPLVTIVLMCIFALIVYLTKYISLGSIICAILLPVLTLLFPIRAGIPRVPLVIITVCIGAFVVYKHRSNIERLKNGTENKFKP